MRARSRRDGPDGPELFCNDCQAYHPLTGDWWYSLARVPQCRKTKNAQRLVNYSSHYRTNRAIGLCGRCDNPAEEGYVYCVRHRAEAAERYRRLNYARASRARRTATLGGTNGLPPSDH